MSSSAVDVEVRLRLKDGASAEMKATAQVAEQTAAQVSTATERAAKRAQESVERSNKEQRSSYEKTSQARETLGIRSEKSIQKEIEGTRRAYAQLAAAGFASAQEQERAYAAVESRITRLTNEMGRLTTAQKKAAEEAKKLAQAEADRERGQKALRYGAAGLAGGAAAAYTLKDPAKEAMSYDRRLAKMANTAYAERDAAGRIIGMKTLEKAVNDARHQGGGTREQAAEALDTMIASGTVSDGDAIKMLPGIMKASTASGADASELATIAIRAKQNFKISADDLPALLSAAMAAGDAGGFELKNMAKWLPQQMAMAKNIGISGKDGFAKLLAWNQAAVTTAGTKDEAGNNLKDLFEYLNQGHFKKYLAEQYLANGHKAKNGEKEKRIKSIDEIFLDYQERGVDKVSATLDIMGKVFAKDKTYQSLQTKLRRLDKSDETGRREILEAMVDQVKGSSVGKVFHNQQSLLGLLGIMNDPDYVDTVRGKVRGQYSAPEDKSSISTAHKVISSTADYKLEQAAEEKKVGQKAAMDSLTPAIGRAAEAFGDLAGKYPLLIGATTLAATALSAFAGVAGLTALLMGGKLPGAGAISRYAGQIAGSGNARKALSVGKVGGLTGLGALAGGYALEKGFGEESAITRYGSSALNGAAIGATLGSIVPVLGTGIGAAVGGAGGLLWEGIKDLLKPAEQKPVDVNFKGQLSLAPGLVLQGQNVQSSGGNVQMSTGNLWEGAP